MADIDKLNEHSEESFNVAVKIVRITANFYANKTQLVAFLAGDATGVINCVCRNMNFIEVDNVIHLLACKIHMRNGKKQIQPHGRDSIKLSRYHIQKVDTSNNISSKGAQ